MLRYKMLLQHDLLVNGSSKCLNTTRLDTLTCIEQVHSHLPHQICNTAAGIWRLLSQHVDNDFSNLHHNLLPNRKKTPSLQSQPRCQRRSSESENKLTLNIDLIHQRWEYKALVKRKEAVKNSSSTWKFLLAWCSYSICEQFDPSKCNSKQQCINSKIKLGYLH